MKAIKGNGACKSCGCSVTPGELRCVAHERAFKQWLIRAEDDSAARGAHYTPRFNGVHGVAGDEEYARRKRIAFSLVPGLRPEQPLKFD